MTVVGSGTAIHDPPVRGHREADPAGRSLGHHGEARGAHRAGGRAGAQVPSPVEAIVAAEAQLINQDSGVNANVAGEIAGGKGVRAGARALQSDDISLASAPLIPTGFRRKR